MTRKAWIEGKAIDFGPTAQEPVWTKPPTLNQQTGRNTKHTIFHSNVLTCLWFSGYVRMYSFCQDLGLFGARLKGGIAIPPPPPVTSLLNYLVVLPNYLPYVKTWDFFLMHVFKGVWW